ncbi:hypothetical protein TREES_T100011900 [Tupaia chinensis]|uniref:Uncharacterized protein n=1 Tax=Tupaia chinensis TaxID=246437 RepID=L9KXW6_TUPCH|nr:hypothetical protein TREES_T100011900 [Tupaia chinensis]
MDAVAQAGSLGGCQSQALAIRDGTCFHTGPTAVGCGLSLSDLRADSRQTELDVFATACPQEELCTGLSVATRFFIPPFVRCAVVLWWVVPYRLVLAAVTLRVPIVPWPATVALEAGQLQPSQVFKTPTQESGETQRSIHNKEACFLPEFDDGWDLYPVTWGHNSADLHTGLEPNSLKQ